MNTGGMFPLSVKTTSHTAHVLYFTSEGARDAFIEDNVRGAHSIMLADGYDLDSGE